MIIGEQVKAARALLGWTQVELAGRAGVSAASVVNIESARLTRLDRSSRHDGVRIRRRRIRKRQAARREAEEGGNDHQVGDRLSDLLARVAGCHALIFSRLVVFERIKNTINDWCSVASRWPA
jgi:hypothetical protein